ncbi:MAG: hypothetical protein RMZ41_017400 [Nostoc sp. DedVER02]|uniref:hypothetical protein n=1 Tax=Nostoc sp. DedVER02 TaxID=3075405 RepID=UPI002AD418E1|nr:MULTISPECIES: hypothetical protein [unclassified Nostoc]MDZ7985167.1 hypothetical protein [Nostoc sp. DedVER02]MDZ8115105.1 hypothetical protein [Nostoc sp. DedVER01b]
MQLSYLPLAWLKNIEQSIVKQQLILKTDIPLPQILALMKGAIAPMRLSCTVFFRRIPQLEGNSCQA